MLPRLSSLLANSILANGALCAGIVLPNDFRIFPRVTQPTHIELLNALGIEVRSCEGSLYRCPQLEGWFAHVWAVKWLLYREGGSYAGQSVSAPIVSSLDFFDCPFGELLKSKARSNPDKMLIFASLLEERIPVGWLVKCSSIGDCNRSPTPEPDDVRLRQLAESTILFYLILHAGRVFGNILARSQPLPGLSWTALVGIIPNSLNSMAHCSILPVKSGLCRILRRVDRLTRSPGGLENRAGAFGSTSKG
ncbi:hypothetical protein CK203_006879 [Vitis vinifera]|uniref:Uncharacterized protein n=1 Tax=Vitis vinifera TaxID=29760 RepID=A0A438KCP4_VITVI|nr:hypothetical protein CK203_006879 [Vitis vinifera]